MMTQPPTAERLLEGLAPATPFRDAIIGDLAEQFRQYADERGSAAARRWYYREAVRVAPHLLFAWLRRFRGADVKHLANAVIPSCVFSLMISFFVMLTGTSALSALGYSAKTAAHGPISQVVMTIGLIGMAVGAMAGGAIAAWLDRETPFAAALALGIVYALCHFSVSFAGPHILTAPRMATDFVTVVGAMMGGLLHAHLTRLEDHAEAV